MKDFFVLFDKKITKEDVFLQKDTCRRPAGEADVRRRHYINEEKCAILSNSAENFQVSMGCMAAASWDSSCWALSMPVARTLKYTLTFGSVPEGRTMTVEPPSRL